MSYNRRGYGYAGSPKIETTTENMQDVVDLSYTEQTAENIDGYYVFNFDNKNDCTVFINGSEYGIFLEAGDGWSTNRDDALITSWIIKESGTKYKWSAHY